MKNLLSLACSTASIAWVVTLPTGNNVLDWCIFAILYILGVFAGMRSLYREN